jgi:hypothetical protein
MAAALLVLTLGGIMVYSALTGTSITEVLAGQKNDTLDAQGGSKITPTTGTGTGSAAGDLLGGGDGTGTSDVIGGSVLSHAAHGLGTFDGKPVALWIIPILKYARNKGWNGHVDSGYRSYADQVRVCATGVKPCATPGTSNHQGTVFPSGAVDVSDAPQLSAILLASPFRNELVWAGAKDPPHFSHPHNGSY